MQDLHTPKNVSNSRPDRRTQLTDALPVISEVNEHLMFIGGLIDIGLFVAVELASMGNDDTRRNKLEHGLEGLFFGMRKIHASALSDLLDVENGFQPEKR